ncbi:MAG: PilZ domain-containing protein [Thermoanaerobaculales bacterium]|nr:PilZ domain-containing protein [Thermoanaerobaculales bacterium]
MNQSHQTSRKILFATDESTKFWGLFPSPEGFDADHACGWSEVVDAATKTLYDVIVVTYPFGNRSFDLFLKEVRSSDSLSRGAGLVVLTFPESLKRAVAFIGRGVNRVISVEETSGLNSVIAEVVDVSPRASARLMVRLQMPLGERDCKIRTFTQNISQSGMLLGTSNMLEVGQRFNFSFAVPESEKVVTGRAEVVRHTIDARDQVSGIGIRFLDLEDQSGQALEGFLKGILSLDDFD